MIEEMQTLKKTVEDEEEKLKEVMKEWRALMLQVPNIPDMSVPEGKDDAENVEMRTWGEKPTFDFTPKSHDEIMKDRNMVDFERGTKIAGFRGYILKNEAALLDVALWQFALDLLSKKGFEAMIVPSLVRKETLYGTGYLPQGEEDLYKTQDDMYLAGTGEVAAMNYYADEIVDTAKLPLKMAALSPCFRREAGSHGKDTKGLIRVHEFMKVEQVILCEASHEQTVKLHEELTANAEEIMQKLEIPYRVINVCGGDLGLGQVKKFDIEAWVPSQEMYRETHSASYFHDFQTRRLNIKYTDKEGKRRFAHSLNNTAVATPRLLVPFIENHQQADGTIIIPEALRPYLGGRETL
jgi:seryl-tRNA synthetase